MEKANDENIEKTIRFVKQYMAGNEPGHDWWHVYRVWKLSLQLARNYDADVTIIQLAALLHDVFDAKLTAENKEKTIIHAVENHLAGLKLNHKDIEHILQIIHGISFKKHQVNQQKTIEFKIVQDADRLDATGAIGIARAFSYGGHKNREMYNPELKPQEDFSENTYINSHSPTLNHFYEKLLKLKDLMNTPEARLMAEERHAFMLSFLEQFNQEWPGSF